MDLFSNPDQALVIHSFDLPQAEVILYEHFFAGQESDRLHKALISKTIWQQDRIKIYGKTLNLPRLTAWYGDKDYGYSGITMQVHPWTDDLLFIKKRIEQQVNTIFTGVLLNYYRNGDDSVGWHADDENELGTNPVIASVSFGATRSFQLRHKTNKSLKKLNIPLSHGSLLVMQGTTQHFWEHQVPKTAKPMGPRINLTFRVV